MCWKVFCLTFRLETPLHVGFHKVLHYSRTRYYIPGKLLWGALTAKITPLLESNDYKHVGSFLKKSMRLGYFFPYVKSQLLLPKFTKEGIKYGSFSKNEFEKRFISSVVSTEIEPGSFSTGDGMLRELECFQPYQITAEDNEFAVPVYFKGILWTKNTHEDDFDFNLIATDSTILVKHREKEINLFTECFNYMQVGGERRYGFGRIKLQEIGAVKKNTLDGFPGKWFGNEELVSLEITEGDAIWGHLKFNEYLKLKGNMEPLVGREWDKTKGAGRKITSSGLCWVPGSIAENSMMITIDKSGVWISC